MSAKKDQGAPSQAPQISPEAAKRTDQQIIAPEIRATRSGQPTVSDLMTMAEAANYLRISYRSLWTQKTCGAIPTVRMGKCIRISRATLDEFIRKSTRKGCAR